MPDGATLLPAGTKADGYGPVVETGGPALEGATIIVITTPTVRAGTLQLQLSLDKTSSFRDNGDPIDLTESSETPANISDILGTVYLRALVSGFDGDATGAVSATLFSPQGPGRERER